MPPWCCISCILLLHVYLSLVSAGNTPVGVYYNTTQLQSECICEYATKEINDGDCLTSENEGQYYHGHCPISHNFNRTDRMSSQLPCNPCKPDQLNRLMCDHYNRKGLLCRKCREGYGLAVYSYDQKCVDCSKLSIGYAITVYLMLEFIPVTLFFICIVSYIPSQYHIWPFVSICAVFSVLYLLYQKQNFHLRLYAVTPICFF